MDIDILLGNSFGERIARKDEIIYNLQYAVGGIFFTDSRWGVMQTQDYIIIFDVGEENMISGIRVRILGHNGAMGIIELLCELLDLKAFYIEGEEEVEVDFEVYREEMNELVVYEEQIYKDRIKTFKKWDALGIIPFLMFWAGFAYIWYLLLGAISRACFRVFGGNTFTIIPDGSFWVIPGMFLGMVSSIMPLFLFYKLVFKERYNEFIENDRYLLGIDGLKVLKHLSLFVVTAALSLTILGINWYTTFNDSRITINRFWAFNREVYEYKEVEGVYEVSQVQSPSGNILDDRHYVIKFKDGTAWSSRETGRDVYNGELDRSIAEFVSQKSGRPINKVNFMGNR